MHSTDSQAELTRFGGRGAKRGVRRFGRLGALGAVVILSVSTLAACGGSSSDEKSAGSSSKGASEFKVSEDKALHDALPASYKSSGVKAAVFNDWAPDEFLNAKGDLDGWSVDLAKAMSDKLGVPFDFTGTSFEAILPAIQNKRFDVGFASFAPIGDRLPVLDFIPQKQDGTGYASLKADNISIDAETDLCGHSVAVLTGAYDYQVLRDLSKGECASSGAGKIDIKQFPQQAAAELAMSSGRVEIVAAGATKLQYLAKQKPEIAVASYTRTLLPDTYVSIGVRKGDKLGTSLKDALQALIDDGTYEKIMVKWGLGDNPELFLKKAMMVTEANPKGV